MKTIGKLLTLITILTLVLVIVVGCTGSQGIQGLAGPQGATGPQGEVGSQGSQGDAGPQGATGPEGPEGNEGPTGPRGDQGIQGFPGTDGATWYNGTGAPAGSLGVIGDFYLDNDNGWVYKKTGASTWEYQVTMAIDKPLHSAEQIALLKWYEEGGGRDYVSIYTYNVGGEPWGICFDGTYIWVTNFDAVTVSKLLD